jgi:hypothetical protein
MKKQALLKAGINCIAWNKDKTMCALCPNSSEILVYDTKGSKNYKEWRLLQVLEEVKLE